LSDLDLGRWISVVGVDLPCRWYLLYRVRPGVEKESVTTAVVWCVTQGTSETMETVALSGSKSGHGINIADVSHDGAIVDSVELGSPAHQSEKIVKGTSRCVHYCTLPNGYLSTNQVTRLDKNPQSAIPRPT